MRRNRSTMKRERIIMLVSSVFVLTALTMTGFYVKGKNEAEQDGYIVDMSALEEKTGNKTKEIERSVTTQQEADVPVTGNDLDYDPNFQEASSSDVSNPENAKSPETAAGDDGADGARTLGETAANKEISEETADEPAQEGADEAQAASSEAAKALAFQEKDALSWPVAGNVLINYSMDKTVYFPTLQQYRYSPAIVIAATEGETIAAAADGKVLSVFEDPQIGRAVTMDIGNGYELTYGQLDDIAVLQGDVVSEGDAVGTIAAPTKYYSTEGANLYFQLTKDGEPVNPLGSLE